MNQTGVRSTGWRRHAASIRSAAVIPEIMSSPLKQVANLLKLECQCSGVLIGEQRADVGRARRREVGPIGNGSSSRPKNWRAILILSTPSSIDTGSVFS